MLCKSDQPRAVNYLDILNEHDAMCVIYCNKLETFHLGINCKFYRTSSFALLLSAICYLMGILNPLVEIPSAVLQAARRAFGAHEAERALLHLKDERHADFLWAQCNRCVRLRDP